MNDISQLRTDPATYLKWAEHQAATIPGISQHADRSVDRVAVIGAGTMGSGIAVGLAVGGVSVDLIEQTDEAAEKGHARVRQLLQSQIDKGRLSPDDGEKAASRVTPTTNWEAVSAVDFVIEAAFEDMAVKKEIFSRLDKLARKGAVLATNTSYLDVNEIAGATSRRGDVLGLHFFSPAHIMRLVEVVRGQQTSSEALAAALSLARTMKKLPIVAGVCDGFIGNRIFAAYRRHAEYLLEDGASPQQIDDALKAYGFAMGPFAVSDMSGLDIAWAMRKRRASSRDPNERYVSIPDLLCEAGRLGKKVGKGWFDYTDGKAMPSKEVDDIIASERRRSGTKIRDYAPEEIQRRILAASVNEASRVIEDGIALRASDIDLVFTNGYGFPKSKGGPIFAADQVGLAAILDDVRDAARAGGAGSEPSNTLIRLAGEGKTLFEWQEEISQKL